MRGFYKIIIITVISIIPVLSFAQPGSLDIGFGTGGKVTTDFNSNFDQGWAVIIQPDGKILVAGTVGTSLNFDFGLVRYNSDGTLDNSFDTDGLVSTDFGNSADNSHSLALQTDGKIILAGWSRKSSKDSIALVRYNTDGSLDYTFNTDGKILTGFGGNDIRGTLVALQGDGKIVVAGWVGQPYYDFALVRYNIDGSLDNNFGSNGIVKTNVGVANSIDQAYSLAIQNDGKIVLSGNAYNGIDYDFATVRYKNDGGLDSSFGTYGKVLTSIGANDDFAYSMKIQSDDKILVAGISWNGGDDFSIVRYNTDGSLDNTFDFDGILTTDLGTTYDVCYSINIQNDGKILAAGSSYFASSGYDIALVRYNIDGSLDNTFDTDGKVFTDFGTLEEDHAFSVTVQNDGKILVGGSSHVSSHDFAVARYYSFPLGIKENYKSLNIDIFPNPGNNLININWENAEDFDFISVLDVTGRTLLIKEVDGKKFLGLNIQDLSAGIYFLEFKKENTKFYKKIVKE
jgi:uncharacterized delta-60 repeat protein